MPRGVAAWVLHNGHICRLEGFAFPKIYVVAMCLSGTLDSKNMYEITAAYKYADVRIKIL